MRYSAGLGVVINLRIDIIEKFKDIRSRISLLAASELLKGVEELASSDLEKGLYGNFR
jgi:hypothetical protein